MHCTDARKTPTAGFSRPSLPTRRRAVPDPGLTRPDPEIRLEHKLPEKGGDLQFPADPLRMRIRSATRIRRGAGSTPTFGRRGYWWP